MSVGGGRGMRATVIDRRYNLPRLTTRRTTTIWPRCAGSRKTTVDRMGFILRQGWAALDFGEGLGDAVVSGGSVRLFEALVEGNSAVGRKPVGARGLLIELPGGSRWWSSLRCSSR